MPRLRSDSSRPYPGRPDRQATLWGSVSDSNAYKTIVSKQIRFICLSKLASLSEGRYGWCVVGPFNQLILGMVVAT